MSTNTGFDPAEISRFKKELEIAGKPYQYIDEDEVSPDMVEFMFIGQYDQKAVIYDCLIGTLRLAYESNLLEMAEARTRIKYPEYKAFEIEVDDEGNATQVGEEIEEVEEYKAYCVYEIEESGDAAVAESVETDTKFEFGIGLEVYLNVPEITDQVILEFIDQFNTGNLKLDPVRYSFESDEDEEDE